MVDSTMRPIKTFSHEYAIQTAAVYLESQGIQTEIRKDDCGGLFPSMQTASGIQLLVRPEDEEKARALLVEMENENKPKEKHSSAPVKPVVSFIAVFVAGVIVGILFTMIADEIHKKNPKVFKTDINADHQPDLFSYYHHGKLVRTEEDRNYDGNVDAWQWYGSKDILQAEFDDNFDKVVDGWVSYQNKDFFTWKYDSDFNGKVDAIVWFEHGQKTKRDWQPNESQMVTKRELFENGSKKQEYLDNNQDGEFEVRIDFDAMENEVQRVKLL